jgi:hypothetical protein
MSNERPSSSAEKLIAAVLIFGPGPVRLWLLLRLMVGLGLFIFALTRPAMDIVTQPGYTRHFPKKEYTAAYAPEERANYLEEIEAACKIHPKFARPIISHYAEAFKRRAQHVESEFARAYKNAVSENQPPPTFAEFLKQSGYNDWMAAYNEIMKEDDRMAKLIAKEDEEEERKARSWWN